MTHYGKPMSISALPAALQRQVRRQLGGYPDQARPTIPPAAPKPPRGRQGPNKTEERFRREYLEPRGIKAVFEGATFRLANGHRYTPDWVWLDETGRAVCVEVKGSYKLPSYQRARMAYDQARIEWPGIIWIWVTWTGKEWRVET